MLKLFKISILLFFFFLINPNLLFSNDLIERIKKAEKSVSDAEDAFAIGSNTAHYKNTTIRILDDLEPLTKYIIEHSGLDPKH